MLRIRRRKSLAIPPPNYACADHPNPFGLAPSCGGDGIRIRLLAFGRLWAVGRFYAFRLRQRFFEVSPGFSAMIEGFVLLQERPPPRRAAKFVRARSSIRQLKCVRHRRADVGKGGEMQSCQIDHAEATGRLRAPNGFGIVGPVNTLFESLVLSNFDRTGSFASLERRSL
jgi:hypothetical protein